MLLATFASKYYPDKMNSNSMVKKISSSTIREHRISIILTKTNTQCAAFRRQMTLQAQRHKNFLDSSSRKLLIVLRINQCLERCGSLSHQSQTVRDKVQVIINRQQEQKISKNCQIYLISQERIGKINYLSHSSNRHAVKLKNSHENGTQMK